MQIFGQHFPGRDLGPLHCRTKANLLFFTFIYFTKVFRKQNKNISSPSKERFKKIECQNFPFSGMEDENVFFASRSCLKRPEMQRKVILKLYYLYYENNSHFRLCIVNPMLENSNIILDLSLFILRIVRVSTCLIMMTNFVKYDNERSRLLMRQNTSSLARNKTTNYLLQNF